MDCPVLIVGDGFIAAAEYADVIARLPADQATLLAPRGVALISRNSEHHAAGVVSEVKDPNRVPTQPKMLTAVAGFAMPGRHFAAGGADVSEVGTGLKLISVARAGSKLIAPVPRSRRWPSPGLARPTIGSRCSSSRISSSCWPGCPPRPPRAYNSSRRIRFCPNSASPGAKPEVLYARPVAPSAARSVAPPTMRSVPPHKKRRSRDPV